MWKKEVSDMLANGRRDSEVMEVTKTTGRSGFGRGQGAGVWFGRV